MAWPRYPFSLATITPVALGLFAIPVTGIGSEWPENS